MDMLNDFVNWAWARHHNPLSWYVRPFFVLPFCYFAYRRNVWGVVLTIVAVASSMFWFPAPQAADAGVASFLAMERAYVAGGWTLSKIALTALIPIWFIALAFAFWRRSWLAGFVVINLGVALKIVWSFHFGGTSAWSTVAPVALGLIVCNGVLLFAYKRTAHRDVVRSGSLPLMTSRTVESRPLP
jgi:hypothetical protein